MSNSELLDQLRSIIEELNDNRDLSGVCIYVQSHSRDQSALFMIGQIRELDIVRNLNTYFKNISE